MPEPRKPFAFVTDTGQVIRGDVLDQYALKAVGDHANPDSRQIVDTFTQAYGSDGVVQPLYNPEALAHVLEINAYHYRACKTKARDAAGMGWYLQPLGRGVEPDEDAQQQITDALEAFATPLTITLDMAQMDYESIGWAAIEMVREADKADGAPIDLVHMPAHTLRRHIDGKRILQIRGTRKRWFVMAGAGVDVDYKNGTVHTLGELDASRRAHEVLWWRNYTSRSDYYGLPDVIPALGAIHGDISRRNYNIAFFDNFGVPAYAVYVTGDFDPGQLDKDGRSDLQRSIESAFKKLAQNPHSVMAIVVPTTGAMGAEGKVEIKFEKLAVETQEASFRMYRIDNRDEVLASHGVPPYRMGIAETGSLGGSTATESTEIYKRSVIDPRQQIIEVLLNQHVLRDGFGITDWRWRLVEIDTRDEAHDLDVLEKLFELGAATPREIARHFAERFSLSAAEQPDDPDDDPLSWHYVNGTPIDAPPGRAPDPDDIEAALRSVRDVALRAGAKDLALR